MDSKVPKEGLEPSRPFGRRILSPLRLPFRHFGLRRTGATEGSLFSMQPFRLKASTRGGASTQSRGANLRPMSRISKRALALVSRLACVAASLALTNCKDEARASERKATDDVTSLATLAEKDVGEVERGLPAGATKMASLFANGADPSKDLAAVRTSLRHIRWDIPDLTVAKSTFFALTDAQGVAIRNDLEQDLMAGQNVVSTFPGLRKALEGSFATAAGIFAVKPPSSSPDRDWVAAAPVKGDQGQVVGLLVTGWTFRSFANHLQVTLRHDVQEALLNAKDTGKLPILYVMVFDGTGMYSASLTPPVNEKALADLDLVAKTAAGPVHGVLNITDRNFGYAAARAPKLGPNAGVAVLRSEI